MMVGMGPTVRKSVVKTVKTMSAVAQTMDTALVYVNLVGWTIGVAQVSTFSI